MRDVKEILLNLKYFLIKYKFAYLIYSFVLFFVVMFIFSNCAKTPEQKQLIKSGKKNLKIKLEGVVYPINKIKIIALATGTIKEVYVQNGTKVKKGQILYEISNRELDLKIKALKKEIRDIKKTIYINRRNSYRVISSKDELIRVAKAQLERISSLYAEGYATKPEVELAEEKYFRLLSERESIKETYESARVDLYKTKREKEIELANLIEQRNNSKVFAPASGYLTGFDLLKNQTVTKGSVIGYIVNLDKVIVKAGIAAGLYQFIHKNDIVTIDFITTPPYKTTARIDRIIPIVDPKIGRMVVEIKIDNPNYLLQDGTKALITILPEKEAQEELYKYFYKKGSNLIEIRTNIK